MAKVIFKSELPDLLAELSAFGEVYAPVFQGHTFESVVFKKYKKGDAFALPYGVTILPPKKFVIPPREELFTFIKGKMTSPSLDGFVIFGVNQNDLLGINRLDAVFAEGIEDVAYKNRKDKRLVVAVDRFSPPTATFDLYLMEVEPELYVGFAGSKKGMTILKSKLFKSKSLSVPTVKKGKDTLLLNPNLPRAIEKSKNHPVWKELAEICFGCGICSYVCPMCYCFETEDALDKTGGLGAGKRLRTWDSCLLPHFAETNAGNFRKELEERIYNWYFHKFVRMPKEVGFVGCVDCNRCVVYCPAKINYRKTLEKVLLDYEKERKASERVHLHSSKN